MIFSRLVFVTICVMLIITNLSSCFINIRSIRTIAFNERKSITSLSKYKKQRNVYSSYLIGLKKHQRKIFPKNTNIDTMNIFMNFTKHFSENYTTINNTNMCAENIIMGNIILDVSDVKYIHIATEKEHIKIKLDNNPKNTSSFSTDLIFNGLQNMDIIFTTVGLVGKFININ